MDLSENLSPRVLLRNILITEPPRTPVTRSHPNKPSTSGVRRSTRLTKKNPDAQSPQNILRRGLKQKLHESIIRRSFPAPKRRTASLVNRRLTPSAASSMLFGDGETPRHLLRNILQTEPVKSPVIHEKWSSEEPEPPPADDTVTKSLPSFELSGLDLPDVTTGNVASTAKGLSRKRPRRSLNITAFEKRLKDGDDAEEETENSTGEYSSLSLSSSTSLSLKTPFVDVRTEKKGLQRKVSNRRKITEEEFGEALKRWEMEGVSSFAQTHQDLGKTTFCEGVTLGLSKLSEPDITADIVNTCTALGDQPDDVIPDFSIAATEDKSTIMVSQLQREMQERMEQSNLGGDQLMFTNKGEIVTEPQNNEGDSVSQLQEDVDEGETQKYDGHSQHGDAVFLSKSAGESQTEEEEGAAESQMEEEEDAAESQTEEEEGAAESLTEEEEGAAESQMEEEEAAAESLTEEEEGAAESQTEEEEGAAESLTEEEEGAGESLTEEEEGAGESQMEEEEGAGESQMEEEEGAGESQIQDSAAESQSEDVEAGSQTEDKEGEEAELGEDAKEQEDDAANSQSQDGVEAGSLSDENEEEYNLKGEEEEKEDVETLEHLECDLERINRRAHRSEGALTLPVIEAGEDLVDTTGAGWSDAKRRPRSAVHLSASLRLEGNALKPDGAEHSEREQEGGFYAEDNPESGKETLHLLGLTRDAEFSGPVCDAPPEEPPVQDDEEQDEEWEDEDEEFPSKTPAFVREKRTFFHSDHLASPVKNIHASDKTEVSPVAKPKKVRQRKKETTKMEKILPKTYLMSVFKHFAKAKVSADVYPVLNEIMNKFFGRMVEDLETYAAHAKRKTIEVEDAILLLKRQGYVNDKVPVEVLIEKYLRMDQRKILIPIATSGNVVIPKRRR